MQRLAAVILGATFGVLLIIVALATWQRADLIVQAWEPHKAALALWAVRCAAIAVVAAGEVLLIAGVVGSIYRRDTLINVLGLSALAIFMLSLVSAVTLGILGR
jgi:hypothetical protein